MKQVLQLCLLQTWMYACSKVSCWLQYVDVKALLVCAVNAVEFTLVPLWLELPVFRVRHKYDYLESSRKYCSLACAFMNISRVGCMFLQCLLFWFVCMLIKLGKVKHRQHLPHQIPSKWAVNLEFFKGSVKKLQKLSHYRPWGLQKFEDPKTVRYWYMKMVRFSALCTVGLYP